MATVIRDLVLQHSMRLDTFDWDFTDQIAKNGSIDAKAKEVFDRHILVLSSEHQTLCNGLQEADDPLGMSVQALHHFGEKIKRLQSKYSAQPAPAQPAIPPGFVSQKVCAQNGARQPLIEQPQASLPLARRNVSFSVTAQPAQAPQPAQPAAAPSVSTTLNRMSFLLRNNNEAQALEECKTLPPEVKLSVFAGLWVVCGQPEGGHPMAHGNFGEVSFFNQEQRCASTSHQKACAVELVKTQNSIKEMISLLNDNKFEQAKEIFLKLPNQVQRAVYAKHWEVCGKPMPGNSMAHDNFGEVSFLGTVDRCNVLCSKKAETLTQYVPLFMNSSKEAQKLVPVEIALWKQIDESQDIRGQDKNAKKIESIHTFSDKIIRSFLGQNVKIEVPASRQRPGYKGLATDYAEKYPFLKPFLLQLENSLTFQGEQLENLPQAAQNGAPKSSIPQDPKLGDMPTYQDRTNYRIGIMNETLDTLKKDGYYINSKGKKVTLNLGPAIQSLELVPNANSRRSVPNTCKTQLFLDNKDCFTVVRECTARGLNPIVLDAASNGHFGGGYMTGAGAQEEYLCRASGLSVAVDPRQGKQQQNFYPLDNNGDAAGLYVANVPVFRGEENQGYPYLDEPFETAVAVVAAYNFNFEYQTKKGIHNPLKLEKGYQGELRIPQAQIEGTKGKVRTILHMAEAKGHDAVVLVALGCGAFCTPPSHMCDLMMQVIVDEFPHSFKEIRFAVIDDHNTGKPHNSKGNVAEFKQMIGCFAEPMKKAGITFQAT